MLRHRWDAARNQARAAAIEAGDDQLAKRIGEFQFRDIRPKAATEINRTRQAEYLPRPKYPFHSVWEPRR